MSTARCPIDEENTDYYYILQIAVDQDVERMKEKMNGRKKQGVKRVMSIWNMFKPSSL
jgi:hypothetical protein